MDGLDPPLAPNTLARVEVEIPSSPAQGEGGRGPEAPEYETPVAQGEKDEGEAEVEEREEGGLTQTAMEMGE